MSDKPFRPMLASVVPDDPEKMHFPYLASRKFDGIRCLVREGEAVSRTLRPIQNTYIRNMLRGLPPLDGELMLDRVTNFSDVSSAVMSRDGMPPFRYYVFDWLQDEMQPFFTRFATLSNWVNSQKRPFIKLVEHWTVTNMREVSTDMESVVAEGYEGLMLRSPTGYYKQGRSTVKQGLLLKVKRFHDSEATVVGFRELHKNTNELKKDALGYAERSGKSAGMVPQDTLGALQVEWTSPEGKRTKFALGAGYTDKQRKQLWRRRDEMVGQLVKFKYQEIGSQGRPRLPIFLGLRHSHDM